MCIGFARTIQGSHVGVPSFSGDFARNLRKTSDESAVIMASGGESHPLRHFGLRCPAATVGAITVVAIFWTKGSRYRLFASSFSVRISEAETTSQRST